jgi:hypothetical protein
MMKKTIARIAMRSTTPGLSFRSTALATDGGGGGGGGAGVAEASILARANCQRGNADGGDEEGGVEERGACFVIWEGEETTTTTTTVWSVSG